MLTRRLPARGSDDVRAPTASILEIATLPADGMSAAEKGSFGTPRWRLLD